MNSRGLLSIFIAAITLSGCVAAPSEIPTEKPLPTATEVPPTITPTLKPTVTPFPSLQTQGPYLVYFREANNQRGLVFLDANGFGRKTVSIPENAQFMFVDKVNYVWYVSPDGRWLAYHAGNVSDDCEVCTLGEKDLSLNLMDLSTGETRTIASLLSDDYPANFDENAIELRKRSDIRDEYASEDLVKGEIRNAFSYGIRSLAWSPDGKYLAFAGQMLGYSSDVYMYDVETQEIRRVSSGPEEIAWIEWSPTGEWIMYGSAYRIGEGTDFEVHAARLSDGAISTFIRSFYIDGWLNDHVYFRQDTTMQPSGLRLVDIVTGDLSIVWIASYRNYAVDQENEKILISPWFEELVTPGTTDATVGLSLVNLRDGTRTRLRDDNLWQTIFVGSGRLRFYAIDEVTKEKYFVRDDGVLTPTKIDGFKISTSPNKKFFVVIGDRVNLYTAEGNFFREISLKNQARDIFWRPDSSGFFILADTILDDVKNLYSVDLLYGDPVLVESDLVKARDSGFKWVFPNLSE